MPSHAPVSFDPDVFWDQVRADGECWVWIGSRTPAGYGTVGGYSFTEHFAHRLSWTMAKGPIPAGLWVLHRCDNPPCVNPDHLFLGTALDNARDRDAKGRGLLGRPGVFGPRLTHCKPRGHLLTDRDRVNGCIACRKIRDHDRFAQRQLLAAS